MRSPRRTRSKEPWFGSFMQHTAAHVAAGLIIGAGSAIFGALLVSYTDQFTRVKSCITADYPLVVKQPN